MGDERRRPMDRRSLLNLIGMAAGSTVMYQAMTALGHAGESDFTGPISLSGAPKGASVLILGAGWAGMIAAYELGKAGYELTEMFEADMCCGMGGSYSLKLPEISAPILQRKLTNIKSTGATIVALDCPGCAMQIRGGLDKDGAPIAVRHTAELIADRFDAADR